MYHRYYDKKGINTMANDLISVLQIFLIAHVGVNVLFKKSLFFKLNAIMIEYRCILLFFGSFAHFVLLPPSDEDNGVQYRSEDLLFVA